MFGIRAGVPAFYQSTCKTPTGSCVCPIPSFQSLLKMAKMSCKVNDNVIGDGSNYADAYWEIKYIRAYLSVDYALPTTLSSTSVAPSTAQSQPSGTSGTSVPTTSPTSSAKILRSSIFSWVFPLLLTSMIGLGVY